MAADDRRRIGEIKANVSCLLALGGADDVVRLQVHVKQPLLDKVDEFALDYKPHHGIEVIVRSFAEEK